MMGTSYVEAIRGARVCGRVLGLPPQRVELVTRASTLLRASLEGQRYLYMLPDQPRPGESGKASQRK